MDRAHSRRTILRYRQRGWETTADEVIVEQLVTLTVNGRALLTFRCTPQDLEALALGFLFNEGVIQTASEVGLVRACADGSNVDVWLKRQVSPGEIWSRTSGCSGGLSARGVDDRYPLRESSLILSPERVCQLIGQLYQAQAVYRAARGVHASGFSDGEKIACVAEDIGRHNTLDKLAGRCLLQNGETAYPILVTTGRISSEMLQKSARMGVEVVISRSAASSLAIRMAAEFGITLIGYARQDQFSVYAHPNRFSTTPRMDTRSISEGLATG